MNYINKKFLIINIWFLLLLRSNIFSTTIQQKYTNAKNNYYDQNYIKPQELKKKEQIKEKPQELKAIDNEQKVEPKTIDEASIEQKFQESKTIVDEQVKIEQKSTSMQNQETTTEQILENQAKEEQEVKIAFENQVNPQSTPQEDLPPSSDQPGNPIINPLELPKDIPLPESSPANTENLLTLILKYKYIYVACGIIFCIFTLISKPKKKLHTI